MDISIHSLFEGAKRAKGYTVVIDVFRAFSLECYVYHNHAKEIIPMEKVEEVHEYKKNHPNVICIGERNGIPLEGFDYGNSPSEIIRQDFLNKTILHTTSAGTQGLLFARNAKRVFTGSLVNAKATADFILSQNPKEVSLIALGWNGQRQCEEDMLCAEYIQSLLLGKEMVDIKDKIEELKELEGKKFFNEKTQHIFPKEDYYLCTDLNRFDFVIEVLYEKDKMITRYIPYVS